MINNGENKLENEFDEPDDNKFPAEVSFLAGCAVDYDYIYVTSILDAYNPREVIHSRLFAYISTIDDGRWGQHDIDASIIAVCVKKATTTVGRRLVALSSEGEVEIYSNKDGSIILEKIEHAGVRLGNRGYVSSIREIGDTLFVCGVNDQVYRRREDGQWDLISSGALSVRKVIDGSISMLNSIDGTSETDVYTCGLSGKLCHYNGSTWTRIALSTDEHLNCVRCISPEEVWVCGDNGTVLVGNVNSGFRDVSTIDDNQQFWSLTKFQNKIYLSSVDDGLFIYDNISIKSVDTGLASGLWTNTVDSVPEMLWSFSPKEIACFDGKKWTRINHPDNPEIVD